MRPMSQQSQSSSLNSNKKYSKNKKQMHQDLTTLYNKKSRHFRVFFPILEEDGCQPTDLNECHQIVFPKDMLLHPQTSFYPSHSLLSQEGKGSFLYETDIFKWFDSLTICERINALTCTSPYITEVLANMYRNDSKKGIPCYFAQSAKKLNYQNYILDPSLSKHFKDSSSEPELQFQKYNQQFYLGSSAYQTQFSKYTDAASYNFGDYDQASQKPDHIRLYPQFFEDVFYTRQRHHTEVQTLKVQEPIKYYAQQMLEKYMRFCDVYQYCDTISVDFNLVANSRKFFDLMSSCTEGKAFTSKCNFVFDSNLGIHQIETPYWFKPEKFNTFYNWVAAILEENLWANFHQYEMQKSQLDKNQPALDYLFDYKMLQMTKESQQLVNINNLTNAWLNASTEKKQEVADALLSFKTFTEELKKEQVKHHRELYVKHDFFVSETKFNDVDEVEIQYVVEKSLKFSNKQKFYLTHEFISELFMSMPITIEKSRDVIHRHLLKLIKDMHQDLVIEELLGPKNSNKINKKRKNKKKEKQQNTLESNENDISNCDFNNNKSEIKMAESSQNKNFDQNNKLQKQATKNTNELSQTSIIQSDLSINTCIEHAIENSDSEVLVFKDPINPDADQSYSEEMKIDMQLISNNYVAKMLTKIELELIKDKKSDDATSKDEGSLVKKQKRKKYNKKVKDPAAAIKGINQDAQISENNPKLPIQSESINKAQNTNLKPNKNKDIQEKNTKSKPSSEQQTQVQKENSSILPGQDKPVHLQPPKPGKKKKNNKSISIMKTESEFNINDLIVETLDDQRDLVIKKTSTLNVQKRPANKAEVAHSSPGRSHQGNTQSRTQSRQGSPQSSVNPETQSAQNQGGRKRNRKKNKAVLDPQEAMNQFIQQLNSKKDEFKPKLGNKNQNPKAQNAKIPTSRQSNEHISKNSEQTNAKNSKKTESQAASTQAPQGKKTKTKNQNSAAAQDLQQLLQNQSNEKSQQYVEKPGSKGSQPASSGAKQLSGTKVEKNTKRPASDKQLSSERPSASVQADANTLTTPKKPTSPVLESQQENQEQKVEITSPKTSDIVVPVPQDVTSGPDQPKAKTARNQQSNLVAPSSDNQSSFLDSNSKISTMSPSFQPGSKALNVQLLNQDAEDEAENKEQTDSKPVDKNLSVTQQNSLEQMAFNLNNIKSFNPSANAQHGVGRLNASDHSMPFNGQTNLQQQLESSPSAFLSALQNQGLANSQSMTSGQSMQQNNMFWSPPEFQHHSSQQTFAPTGSSTMNSNGSMQKTRYAQNEGTPGKKTQLQSSKVKQSQGEPENAFQQLIQKQYEEIKSAPKQHESNMYANSQSLNLAPGQSHQQPPQMNNIVTISDQLNLQNQGQNMMYPQQFGFSEDGGQGNIDISSFVNMGMEQSNQFGQQQPQMPPLPVNFGSKQPAVWQGNAQLNSAFANASRPPNSQFVANSPMKTSQHPDATHPPKPQSDSQPLPPQQLQLSQQTVTQQNLATPNSQADQFAQMSQMNSFNINVFGNLNIGSLVQQPNNKAGAPPDQQSMSNMEQLQGTPPSGDQQQDQVNIGNQIKGLVGMPFMNMPQNIPQQMPPLGQVQSNPNQQQFMAHQAAQQQAAQQNLYQNYFYDFNLSQTIEFKFYEKFDNDIYDEVNRIQQSLDNCKAERNYVINKLQNMCEEIFAKDNTGEEEIKEGEAVLKQKPKQKPKIMQFGSLMTGLALESSDIDMAVTNLFLPDRQKMIDSLDQFAEYLKEWDVITDLNAISTASIPVIKANIELKVLKEREFDIQDKKNKGAVAQDFGDAQSEIPREGKRTSPKEKDSPKIIPYEIQFLKIDITFDDNMNAQRSDSQYNSYDSNSFFDNINQKTHQGLASSQLIKNYVEHYKCLKEVSIILKQFLARMDLNIPYHGGISSYSTVLLLVAYMNKWNLKMSSTLTPSRLLMGFLDYYSYYFNASLFGIDVSNNGSFYELGSPESNIVILDPLNDQNNTTRNSFLTHEIIKSFRKAFNSLKNLLLHYQQNKSTDIQDNLLDLVLQRNQAPIIEQKILQLSSQQNSMGIDPSILGQVLG